MELMHDMIKGEIIDSWKIQSRTDQDGDRTASENAYQNLLETAED